ncbi:MAG: galactose/methyl galactoside ABC transporter permease MglC [Faecousia sp.]
MGKTTQNETKKQSSSQAPANALKPITAKSVGNFLANNAIIIIIAIMVLAVGFGTENFWTTDNAKNLLTNIGPRFIIAAGVSGCLITKGTDLSAGRMVGLGACVAATLLQTETFSAKFFPNMPELPVIVGLLAAVAVTALFGFVNGVVVAYLKVPPFIATLGTQTIIYGLTCIYTGNDPIGGLTDGYKTVAKGNLFGWIPYLALVAIVVGLFMWFLYNKTRHGKYMYAIGGNESAASVAGVNVPATLIRIYTLAGVLYGLAGFLLCSKAAGASTATGQGYELEAIAACTIGGVSTNGGVGTVPGILLGVLVFEILKICLQYMRVDPAYTYVAQGVVIVIAVALDLRKYLAKK